MKTFVFILAQTFRAGEIELLNLSPKYRLVADDICSSFSTAWLRDVSDMLWYNHAMWSYN
jgi:hypothetical protein